MAIWIKRKTLYEKCGVTSVGWKISFMNTNKNFFSNFGFVALLIFHGLFLSNIIGIDNYATILHLILLLLI